MAKLKLGQCLEVIADLIEGQRIAQGHYYEVVWIKDHFVCRQLTSSQKEEFFIIKLMPVSVNEGLTNKQWDIVTSRVVTLIAEGVIK